MKVCKRCGAVKPLTDFYRAAGTRDGYRGECKACNLAEKHDRYFADPGPAKARTKRWQTENPERYAANLRAFRATGGKKRSDRKGHLKRKFGLTPEQYDEMLRQQDGQCWICGNGPAEGQSLDVDHDHTTGEVRALLCRQCNHAIGLFHENPELLMTAAAYLILGQGTGPGRDSERQRIRLVLGE